MLTAGYDSLLDEGAAYADALEIAGVPVERWPFHSQIHGFVRFTGVIASAHQAIATAGAFISRASQ